jgi:hypothetical protein
LWPDLNAGVNQSLNDDCGRVFGVKNLGREIGAAERVGQDVVGAGFALDIEGAPPLHQLRSERPTIRKRAAR